MTPSILHYERTYFILAHLHARPLDLLVDGAHDLPPQHRTLRNAIQRSYDLLADDERVLFRRMGVFVGGCDLEALESVSAWQEEAHPRPLLPTLHGLVGKSLVRAETMLSGDQRFFMLETIRGVRYCSQPNDCRSRKIASGALRIKVKLYYWR